MFDAPGRVGGGSGGGAEGGEPISGPHSPTGSISSVWSSATGLAQPTGPSGQGYKISDRLQIVKPMEGEDQNKVQKLIRSLRFFTWIGLACFVFFWSFFFFDKTSHIVTCIAFDLRSQHC